MTINAIYLAGSASMRRLQLSEENTLVHHRLNPGNALGMFRIYCVTTVLLGLLIASGNVAAASPLWVANEGSPTLAEFQGTLKSGSKKPHGMINDINDLDGSSTIAFDRNENLWVTNYDANSITEFTKSEWQKDSVKKNSDPAAVITINEDAGQNLDAPEGIVFDSSENMWVGAEDGQVILEYTPAQYAANGNPTPNVILNADSFKFSSPSHLAFDAAGNLWVTDENRDNDQGGNGEVFRFNKNQITGLTAGSQNIDPVFGIALQQFVHLETIAFDGGGNLWLADQQGNRVYKFSASQLTATGLSQNLTPAVVLSPAHHGGACNESLDGPYGLALDGADNLYVANSNTHGDCLGSLAKFLAKSIESSGSPKPKVFITTDGKGTSIDAPNALTFEP
jgi:sugar lactone lactonase YvrE